MTEERILQLLESYGADPIRWPAEERAAAQTFLAANETPVLRTAVAEAQAMDGLLDATSQPVLSQEAWGRLRADAAVKAPDGFLNRLRTWVDWPGPLWQPAGAMALSLMVGIWLGISGFGEGVGLADLPLIPTQDTLAPTESIFLISVTEEIGL